MVLVTGAARRIGREIALTLATAGWDVLVHARQPQPEADATAADLHALGARAAVLCADLADEAACNALVPRAVAALGRLDAVVNNASLFEYDDVAGFGHAAMDQHWRANTAPAVLLARALHAHLAERGAQGCVVNLLDQKLANPNPDYFSYTLSKAALQAATVMLAQALAPVLRGGGGVARRHAGVRADERGAVPGRAPAHAAAALVHPGRHRARRALPARVARHHRQHAAGGRWPAPAGPAARRAVPGPGQPDPVRARVRPVPPIS